MGMYRMYGTFTPDLKWKQDAANLLFDRILKNESMKQDIEDLTDYHEWPKEKIKEYKKEYIEDYDDDRGNFGMEGVLVTLINLEQGVDDRFTFEDDVLGVFSYLPADDEEKAKMLTQADIAKILAEYLDPLLEVPATIQMYSVDIDECDW